MNYHVNSSADLTHDSLSSIVHMDMFDANELRAAVSKAPKSFHLNRESAQQPSGSRCHDSYVPIASMSAANTPEHGHSGSVCTGHLNNESAFDLIFGIAGLNEREG